MNDDDESRDFYCDVIIDESAKMNKMVKKLLTLNQIEFGNNYVEMERFDLIAVIDQVLNQSNILLQEKGAEVFFDNQKQLFVWADEFQIEKRMMLDGTVFREKEKVEKDIALNDIVISRSGSLRVIDFKVYVNGEFLNLYSADGIIISTPTGSTAYNLSAGGPIVSPVASLIVVTPICPHTLNTRSMILSADDIITIEMCPDRNGKEEVRLVSFDGDNSMKVFVKDKIEIKKSEQYTEIIQLNKISFLEVLRRKMTTTKA